MIFEIPSCETKLIAWFSCSDESRLEPEESQLFDGVGIEHRRIARIWMTGMPSKFRDFFSIPRTLRWPYGEHEGRMIFLLTHYSSARNAMMIVPWFKRPDLVPIRSELDITSKDEASPLIDFSNFPTKGWEGCLEGIMHRWWFSLVV